MSDAPPDFAALAAGPPAVATGRLMNVTTELPSDAYHPVDPGGTTR